MSAKLPLSFYQRQDTVQIAQDLLGKVIFCNINGKCTAGVITETEAYCGISDKGSHAYGGRRTKRTEVLYQAGGISYLYVCYGIHTLLNVVTAQENTPHAVLIRSLAVYEGKEWMQERRKGKLPLCQGPGVLCQALGLSMHHNGLSFLGSTLWIEDRNIQISAVEVSTRIGIDYAEEDALLPYRFIGQISLE